MDRIDVVLAADVDAGVELVESGMVDVLAEPAPADVVDRYLADPQLRDRVFTESTPRVHYLAMNLAAPPFDDVHVRRAVNWVLDRARHRAQAMREERNQAFVVARHAIPDSLLNNLLVDYAPYGTHR